LAANNATGNYIDAIGYGAAFTATGNYIAGIGTDAANNAVGTKIDAIGFMAGMNTTGTNITAIGYAAAFTATGNYITAIGQQAAVGATGDIIDAIGSGAAYRATGTEITALGNNAAFGAAGNNIIAIGQNAERGAQNVSNVIAIGQSAIATGTNTLALGAGANATGVNSIALGANSTDNGNTGADNTIADNTLGFSATYAGNGMNNGIVSIGSTGTERILTNLAAGAINPDSTDAINGSQLYVTNTTLAALANTLGAGDTTISTTNIYNSSTTIGGAVTNLLTGSAGVFQYNSTNGNITIGTAFTGTVVDISGQATGMTRILTGVSAGNVSATSVDAINGSQLYGTATSIVNMLGTGTVNPDGTIAGGTFATGDTSVNQAITNLYNRSTSLAGDSLLWNNTLNAYDASHGSGVAHRITNVATGDVSASSLDAINGSQLYTMGTSITSALGTGNVNSDGSITNIQFSIGGTTYNNVNSAITSIGDTINNITSGGAGLVQQDTTGNITVGAQTSGTVVNIAGTSGDRQLAGVAAGTADNDAVNIGQLKAAGIITGSGGTVANVVTYDSAAKDRITLGGPAVTGTGANQTGGTLITNLARGAITAASADAVTGSQLYETDQRVTNLESMISTTPSTNGRGASAGGVNALGVGIGAKANGANSTAVGNNGQALADNSVVIGNNAVVLATAVGAVAIGNNSIATEPNTVSFGSPGNERRLTNVADGINPTDAVNMRQLTAFQNYANDRFNRMDGEIYDLGERIDQTGAMAAAMNQVQPRLTPDGNRSQLALGVGGYRGHGAFAMGYGYTSRLGDRGVQASFALSDRGEIMAGAGAIWGW